MNTASHFCYSDFNSIIDSVFALDADMISIENSKVSKVADLLTIVPRRLLTRCRLLTPFQSSLMKNY